MQIPEAFKEKMKKLLSTEEFKALMASYDAPVNKGIRINTLKGFPEEIKAQIPFELEPVDWCPTGYYIDKEVRPGKNPVYYTGSYYVQEPTAMASAEVLAPKPGEWVLDLCAAPGGKSSQLACMLEGKGVLVANELINSRSDILASNIERMGIKNALLLNEFPERLVARFYERFDKILVDAPCSGEGMFRKDSGAAEDWTPERVVRCGEKQKKILETVDKLLKPGGILVYSTCTFSPEENEQIIENFLKNKRYILEEIDLKGLKDRGRPEWAQEETSDLIKTLHIMPFHVKGEGHFIAKLKKVQPCPEPAEPIKLRNKTKLKAATKLDLKDYAIFAKDCGCEISPNLYIAGDRLYSLPEGITLSNLDGLKVLRAGVHIGTFKKNRFEPSHTFAMTLTPNNYQNTYDLKSDDEAYTYLKGEPITGIDLKGWVLVCYKNRPLGFGKASQGMIKNHYPKGLRIRKK